MKATAAICKYQITDFNIGQINDEEIRSYWVSVANDDSIYVTIDLEEDDGCQRYTDQLSGFQSEIFSTVPILCASSSC